MPNKIMSCEFKDCYRRSEKNKECYHMTRHTYITVCSRRCEISQSHCIKLSAIDHAHRILNCETN